MLFKYSKAGDVYTFSIVLDEIITVEKTFSDMDIFNLALKVKNG